MGYQSAGSTWPAFSNAKRGAAHTNHTLAVLGRNGGTSKATRSWRYGSLKLF
ncbi:hypothetical protein FHS09_001851 [Microbulbifer rhizosphaerae]|uniref:Uncharacterized protein n=1 Tax=Microbulbifer rhizosphaerae TaxID=1562603 RepID=A0A7W4WB41_9GAMM|nr:hypothetical protein [Microbulbifer rhizosphaerae]